MQFRVWADIIVAWVKLKKVWSISLQECEIFTCKEINSIYIWHFVNVGEAPMSLRVDVIKYMVSKGIFDCWNGEKVGRFGLDLRSILKRTFFTNNFLNSETRFMKLYMSAIPCKHSSLITWESRLPYRHMNLLKISNTVMKVFSNSPFNMKCSTGCQ